MNTEQRHTAEMCQTEAEQSLVVWPKFHTTVFFILLLVLLYVMEYRFSSTIYKRNRSFKNRNHRAIFSGFLLHWTMEHDKALNWETENGRGTPETVNMTKITTNAKPLSLQWNLEKMRNFHPTIFYFLSFTCIVPKCKCFCWRLLKLIRTAYICNMGTL